MKLLHSPKQKSCQRANTHITTDRQFHTSQQTISQVTTDHFTHHNRPFYTSQRNFTPHNRQLHTSQQTISHLTTDHFTHHNRQTISHLTTDHFTHHNIPFHTSQHTISHVTTDHFTHDNRPLGHFTHHNIPFLCVCPGPG